MGSLGGRTEGGGAGDGLVCEPGGQHLVDLFGGLLLDPVAYAGKEAKGQVIDQLFGAADRRGNQDGVVLAPKDQRGRLDLGEAKLEDAPEAPSENLCAVVVDAARQGAGPGHGFLEDPHVFRRNAMGPASHSPGE